MKKKGLLLGVLLLCAMVFSPMRANAEITGGLFGSTSNSINDSNLYTATTLIDTEDPTQMFGGSITIQNANENTVFYIGVKSIKKLSAGEVISATMNFSNSDFVYKSCQASNSSLASVQCTKEDSTHVKVTITLKSDIPAERNRIVATVSLDGSDATGSTGNCVITLGNVNKEVPTTPKCKVVDGKYYNNAGVEVTKEEYEKACNTSNPETGAFLPVALIGVGVMLVIGLFFATKNNKMYQV